MSNAAGRPLVQFGRRTLVGLEAESATKPGVSLDGARAALKDNVPKGVMSADLITVFATTNLVISERPGQPGSHIQGKDTSYMIWLTIEGSCIHQH